MLEGGALTWREVVDKHHSTLVDELSVRLDSDVREAVSVAVRSRVESLNQVLRRFRSTGEDQVLRLLAESCAPFAAQLVVLVFESNQARAAAGFGMAYQNLSFDTSTGPAIVAAVDSRDPVVALSTAAEISPVLAEAFSPAPDRKAYLFPIVARHSVMAMLVASGVEVSAPIELLCEAAGMKLEPSPSPSQSTPPVQTEPESSRPRAWNDLAPEDQKLHLQAQRTARLRVAEMRLYHESEVRRGIAGHDVYGALKSEIDSARDQFLQTFLAKSPTMVDYLHLEILRSLAHDDDRLLGQGYPGPMV